MWKFLNKNIKSIYRYLKNLFLSVVMLLVKNLIKFWVYELLMKSTLKTNNFNFYYICVHIDENYFDFREFWKLWPQNWKRNCRQWRLRQKDLSRLHISGQPISRLSRLHITGQPIFQVLSPSLTVEWWKSAQF